MALTLLMWNVRHGNAMCIQTHGGKRIGVDLEAILKTGNTRTEKGYLG